MPWQHNKTGGGGPWGGGGGGGGGSGGGGGGQGPWGRGPSGGGGQRPPDFEEMLRRGQDRFRRVLPGGLGSGRSLVLIAVAAVVLWLLSGIYVVDTDEQGVEMRFGKWTDTTSPGLHFNWPTPIGAVETPKVTRTNELQVGFRAAAAEGGRARDIPEESLMLTGDQNIIDLQFVVFWRIADAGKFLFNINEPEDTVHSVSEAAMRQIIGQSPFEYLRTKGRNEVEGRALELIQEILDQYGAGILVEQVRLQRINPPEDVIEAFRDVQAAVADKDRAVNEATAYRSQVTQRAEGEAQRITNNAEAYKQEKIAIAEGDAQRFISVYDEYAKAKDMTTRRIYLETMEAVLRDMNKILIEDSSGAAVPYLSLNELIRQPRLSQPAPEPTP